MEFLKALFEKGALTWIRYNKLRKKEKQKRIDKVQ